MKKALRITSVLLICLLILSIAPSTFGNYASADICAANFLPNYYVPYVDDNGKIIILDTQQEVQLSENTADYISLELNRYYWLYDVRNSLCTDVNFDYCVYDLQNYDSAVIYSKGHLAWASCTSGYAHHRLSMYQGTSQVWDSEIYQLTSSKNVNSFIWHCKTAISPDPNPNTCVCRGLPRAFTHNQNIAEWGSSGSQVYLGWNDNVPYGNPLSGGSPQYSWEIDPTIHSNYSQVAGLYYYYVCQGYSTAQALSMLAQTLFYTSYAYSDLSGKTNSGWLVVYGNMYVGLP
ncbi:MAG: hypothetical protein FWH37_00640 [Candidatus Bathyarchaeota archaeon]|nr:hypothetical protein [Candidatus Termiticorpusculum sp.]